MQYREQKQDTKEFKQTYIDGINRLIRARQQDAEQKRSAYVKDIFADPDAYRADFRKMLGWPLVEHNETALPAVKKTKLADEQGYCIYRMQFEILEGLELTRVEPGEYFLFAPPVPYDGLDGAPVRAVLISDYIFWSKK